MEEKNIRITFLGGAGTVTGSKTLIEVGNNKILIDCGLFQGVKNLRLKNWDKFPVNPKEIDAIILTHAHLDHSGYLPVLVKNGFTGAIHCTHPTQDIAEIILLDSGKIQEESAERANKYGYSKHKEAKPLYTVKEAKNTVENFLPHDYREWVILSNEIKFNFHNAGHILGSSIVELKINDKLFLFSGDLGRSKPMLLPPPKLFKQADFIILESTYGGRNHNENSAKTQLQQVIEDTIKKGGSLFIPSFAVERTQELLYLFYQLEQEGKLPKIPIYLDSPMGVDTTKVFYKYPDLLSVPNKVCEEMCKMAILIKNEETSRSIVQSNRQKIVIAGSGMIQGGRILHYLNKEISSEKNTILLVGYPAYGTRARDLKEGVDEIKFFGEYHKVKAEVREITSLSAHADQFDLITWLKHLRNTPENIFINHGEPQQANALRVKIETVLGWNCTIPSMNESFTL